MLTDAATGRALVFGGNGQIGAACGEALAAQGFDIVRLARTAPEGEGGYAYDPFAAGGAQPPVEGSFEAVVWAQGANYNDNVADVDADRHMELYKANALYVLLSLKALLGAGRIANGARLCVISSVWQKVARRDKLSYMMTKAALQGLVMSASVDLAERGMLVNAVLPGALDTPMTRANLSAEQIGRIADLTPFRRLAAIGDVAALTAFLCSRANTSITGQFIAVDLGFEHARLV